MRGWVFVVSGPVPVFRRGASCRMNFWALVMRAFDVNLLVGLPSFWIFLASSVVAPFCGGLPNAPPAPMSFQDSLFGSVRRRAFRSRHPRNGTSARFLRTRLRDGAGRVVISGFARVFFVLRSFLVGVLLWPATKVRGDVWDLDTSAKAPVWRFDSNLANWSVLPTEVQSPMRRWVSGERVNPSLAWLASPPVSVLDWQVENGFPFVTEMVMRKLGLGVAG